jgi:DNA (cytosine-5)-methyltransferase 1
VDSKVNEDINIWDPSVPVEANYHNWKHAPTAFAPLGERRPKGSKRGPTVVDLFSGCGGISVGFEAAGLQAVLGIDIHQPSIETFRRNHPGASAIVGDIKQVDEAVLRDALGDQKVDVVAGGAPCQGFSLCNRKQYDDDPRNMLFLEYMRIVSLLRPRFVFFENVSTLRSAGDGAFSAMIEAYFDDLGYEVTCGPMNAVEFGVPQKRVRWIFFGALKGTKVGWPVGRWLGKAPRTVEDAIGDLPPLGPGESTDEYSLAPYREYQKLMRRKVSKLLNHAAPSHPPETIERIAKTEPGKPMYPSFKQRIRLKLSDPSPTQVSGGIRPQFSFGHPTEPRGLTIRERCRIQSFPDDFYVTGGIVQGRVQTGNAVPPLVSEAFGRIIYDIIADTKTVEIVRPAKQLSMLMDPKRAFRSAG